MNTQREVQPLGLIAQSLDKRHGYYYYYYYYNYPPSPSPIRTRHSLPAGAREVAERAGPIRPLPAG